MQWSGLEAELLLGLPFGFCASAKARGFLPLKEAGPGLNSGLRLQLNIKYLLGCEP